MTTKELLTFIQNSESENGFPCIEACLQLKGGLFTTHHFCSHRDEKSDLIWHETQSEEEYITYNEFSLLYPDELGDIWLNVEIT